MDPSDLNNRNQINRIATPIRIDSNGVPITAVNNQVKIVENENKNNKKVSINTILVLVLLLLLSIIVALVCYFIIPDLFIKRDKTIYSERTTTKNSLKVINNFYDVSLNDTAIINFESEFMVASSYKINMLNNGVDFNLLVNNKFITNVSEIKSKVYVLDDLLILKTKGKTNRTSLIYFIDINGNIVYKIDKLSNDGMLVLDTYFLNYVDETLIIPASKMDGVNLISDSTPGNIMGTNICNQEELDMKNIGDKYLVTANYAIKYLGNHKFSEAKFIDGTSLIDYKFAYNLCD